MKKFGNVLWGIVFIFLGVVFGLNALEITDIDIFFDGWWTLFIIVPCFIGLFNEKDKMGNVIGLLIGVGLLLCCQNFIAFDVVWKLFFPAILVIIGVSFLLKDTIHSKVKQEIKKLNQNTISDHEYCATFGEQKVDFSHEEFKGGTFTAVFGGVKCDLRESKIKEDVVINASAIFGGIDILVPDDVNVKITSTPIFGGVSTKKNLIYHEKAKTIYIQATCIFGGVDIK